jgi:hypothetical protein
MYSHTPSRGYKQQSHLACRRSMQLDDHIHWQDEDTDICDDVPDIDSSYSKGTLIHFPSRIFLSHWYSKGLHCSEQAMRYANQFASSIHITMWLASRSARLAKRRR